MTVPDRAMSIPLSSASRYKTSFRSGDHLQIGPGTLVEVLGLDAVPGEKTTGGERLTITATVRLTAVVKVWRNAVCEICGTRVPPPSTYDALWYVMENHCNERIVFPVEADAEDAADAYPVEGWRFDVRDDKATCPACVEEMEAAKAAIRRKRAGDGGTP